MELEWASLESARLDSKLPHYHLVQGGWLVSLTRDWGVNDFSSWCGKKHEGQEDLRSAPSFITETLSKSLLSHLHGGGGGVSQIPYRSDYVLLPSLGPPPQKG